MSRLPPIIAFAAPSGTGKTTLIEQVVRVLVGRGLRIGVLKSDAHRVALDTPGKDSWRFAEAGASAVGILTAERLALFARLDGEVSLVAAVDRLFPNADLVLAEGFRRSGLPTIRVHRRGGPSTEDWHPPRLTIAWASDEALDVSEPVLPLGDPAAVADWIVTNFVRAPQPRRVTVVVPVTEKRLVAEAAVLARQTAAALGGTGMLVLSTEGMGRPAGVDLVHDIRPGRGLLGALYTGLAAAETPDVLLLAWRHRAAPLEFLSGLLSAASPAADVVYPSLRGQQEPGLALYGHRCLSAIHAALLSGEHKVTGWWGQVRVFEVREKAWGQWDPDHRAFPRS